MRDTPIPLDEPTVSELARQLAERLRPVETYGAGGCPTCKEAEAFLAVL